MKLGLTTDFQTLRGEDYLRIDLIEPYLFEQCYLCYCEKGEPVGEIGDPVGVNQLWKKEPNSRRNVFADRCLDCIA